MASKLTNMNVNPTLIIWVHDFVKNISQYVKVNGASSSSRNTNTGSPQGSVISPILYTLYTSDCREIQQNSRDILLKYADDIGLAGFICRDDNTTCEEEVQRLTSWCSENYLLFNVKKTKAIAIDFRRNK